MTKLRTYIFINQLQTQVAAFIGKNSHGYLPTYNEASMLIEVEPAISINSLMDVALKSTKVKPSMQTVERAYVVLEIHHSDRGEVTTAGEAILEKLGLNEENRLKPIIKSDEIIRSIEPYQANLINKNSKGNMILEGQSLWILETVPAGYALFAANEAEKNANISVVHIQRYGAFGRVYISGSESDVDSACEAAIDALKNLSGENRA